MAFTWLDFMHITPFLILYDTSLDIVITFFFDNHVIFYSL